MFVELVILISEGILSFKGVVDFKDELVGLESVELLMGEDWVIFFIFIDKTLKILFVFVGDGVLGLDFIFFSFNFFLVFVELLVVLFWFWDMVVLLIICCKVVVVKLKS